MCSDSVRVVALTGHLLEVTTPNKFITIGTIQVQNFSMSLIHLTVVTVRDVFHWIKKYIRSSDIFSCGSLPWVTMRRLITTFIINF